MRFDHYRFHSSWHFAASVEDVAALIVDVPSMPQWLPEVCLVAKELPGEGEWRRFHLELRGFVPHTVCLQAVAKADLPTISIVSTGDLEGTATWSLTEESVGTRVDLVQEVTARAPVLRVASFLFRPLCVANHNWIMRKTGEAMARKLGIQALFDTPTKNCSG